MLDKVQQVVHENFSNGYWLGNKSHVEMLIDWTTFYRRNLPVFIEDYFGIKLHLYQVICIYLLNIFGSIALVASRACAKSFLIALFACAKCVLYPNTSVVVASSTKKQAALIVTEKIEKELMGKSANLRREVSGIKNNANDTEVKFKNGSSIVVVVANDNARGYRSTILVFEEFRRIKKNIVDSVLKPFQIARPAVYRNNNKYQNLIEEPVCVYISSSGTTSEWIWDTCKTFIEDKYKDNSSCLIALDYAITLKHGIKTRKQLESDKKTIDPITWRIEYENEMLRENTNAFFPYNLMAKNQVLKKCFYPRKNIDVIKGKKNPYVIPKQPNEIRIISCDFAFVDKKNNDNSVYSCIRLVPENVQYRSTTPDGISKIIKQGYRRKLCYIEGNRGGDVDLQAIRVKQLFEDFSADYAVLDTRNGGVLVYDRLAKILYDEERDLEYQAWTCMNDESIANRVKVAGALPVVFAISATSNLNSEIATSMWNVLSGKQMDLLIDYNKAIDDVLSNIPEYTNEHNGESMVFYERPYLETQKLISEMVALEYEKGIQTGVIRIYETGTNTKDRYTSVSYANYFASLLEQDLLSDQSDFEYITLIN